MAIIASVALTQPTSDPNVTEGNTFTIGGQITKSNHGGLDYNMYAQWDQGTGTWVDIPTTGAALTVSASPIGANIIDEVEHTATVTGVTAGSYNVRIRTVDNNDTGAEDFSSSQGVTVVGDTVDDLLADDVQSTSEVSSPSVGQKHILNATDVQSTSEVSSPAVGQVHGLSATSVQSTAEVSSPNIAIVSALLANDIESASEVTSPAIGQIHNFTATSVQSASEVSSPAIGQVQVLSSISIESATEVSAPNLAEVGGGVDNLLADDVESSSEVTAPTISQVHVLAAVSVESNSEVTAPTLAEVGGTVDNLLADDIESTSEVSTPSLGQVHVITVNSVQSISVLSSPSLGGQTSLAWYDFQILGEGDAYDPLYGLFEYAPTTYGEYLALQERRRGNSPPGRSDCPWVLQTGSWRDGGCWYDGKLWEE